MIHISKFRHTNLSNHDINDTIYTEYEYIQIFNMRK